MDGVEFGPLGAADVRRLILAGSADESLLVRSAEGDRWQRAGDLDEFSDDFGKRSRIRLRTAAETPQSKKQRA